MPLALKQPKGWQAGRQVRCVSLVHVSSSDTSVLYEMPHASQLPNAVCTAGARQHTDMWHTCLALNPADCGREHCTSRCSNAAASKHQRGGVAVGETQASMSAEDLLRHRQGRRVWRSPGPAALLVCAPSLHQHSCSLQDQVQSRG